MAIDNLQTLDVIEAMENYLMRNRPPESIRPKLDLGYKIEGQSIIVFEIRPQWNDPQVILELPFAKTTFVKTKNNWKVFWMRSNLSWCSYEPKPTVKNVKEFTKLIEEDKHHCFLG
ncbi:MAG: DUF3024 domain-containing protein [Bacteroidetes bacterium]|nr:DUF3024 domain-containing protein [Bacteroidota bacterium]MBS1540913.1 DUF3024 domain-containing protein [Bacteroidota bacterium]